MNHAEVLRAMAEYLYLPSAISASEVAVLLAVADYIEALEAEIHRLRHFAWVIEEHGEALVTEAAIALHPQVKVDVVRDGSIGHATGHGPNDPPRPVQRHD